MKQKNKNCGRNGIGKRLGLLAVIGALNLSQPEARGAEVFLFPTNPVPVVVLAWDASPEPSLAGYNVYYGVASGAYTNKVSAGKTNTISLKLPAYGTTYFFAATCVSSNSLESEFSNEVNWRTPTRPDPVSNLHTNMVTISMNVENAPTPTGPWSLYANLGTEATAPAYFRSVLQIQRPLPQPPPIPGK